MTVLQIVMTVIDVMLCAVFIRILYAVVAKEPKSKKDEIKRWVKQVGLGAVIVAVAYNIRKILGFIEGFVKGFMYLKIGLPIGMCVVIVCIIVMTYCSQKFIDKLKEIDEKNELNSKGDVENARQVTRIRK